MQEKSTDAEATRRAAIKVAHDRLDVFAVSILTLLCILLGIGQVAMKVANAGISPVLQAGLRSLLAAGLVARARDARGHGKALRAALDEDGGLPRLSRRLLERAREEQPHRRQRSQKQDARRSA